MTDLKICKKCNSEVIRCVSCDKYFDSEKDIACVKTDFFGDGTSVFYKHLCIKCAKELLVSSK